MQTDAVWLCLSQSSSAALLQPVKPPRSKPSFEALLAGLSLFNRFGQTTLACLRSVGGHPTTMWLETLPMASAYTS